jgi:hypothetical protein
MRLFLIVWNRLLRYIRPNYAYRLTPGALGPGSVGKPKILLNRY